MANTKVYNNLTPKMIKHIAALQRLAKYLLIAKECIFYRMMVQPVFINHLHLWCAALAKPKTIKPYWYHMLGSASRCILGTNTARRTAGHKDTERLYSV